MENRTTGRQEVKDQRDQIYGMAHLHGYSSQQRPRIIKEPVVLGRVTMCQQPEVAKKERE